MAPCPYVWLLLIISYELFPCTCRVIICAEDCVSKSSCSAGHILFVMGISKGFPHYFCDIIIIITVLSLYSYNTCKHAILGVMVAMVEPG